MGSPANFFTLSRIGSFLCAKYHPCKSASSHCSLANPYPYPIPEVCVNKSLIVMARLALTTLYCFSSFVFSPSVTGSSTVDCSNSGMYLDNESESSNLPSSWSIIIPTLTKAFVCEAIRKILSLVIGTWASKSLIPKDL